MASVSLGWIGIISALFLWWPNNRYAATGTFWFGVLLVVYYFGWAIRNFQGPQALQSDELRRRERLVGETRHGEAEPGRAGAN